jgi:crossover junction endodeoxyribonuclease RuvC
MRIIGIDPGTGIVGFGIIDVVSQKPTMVDAGVIRTAVHQPLDERLELIFNEIGTVMDEHKPQVMVIEQLFFSQNVTTGMSVAHARGVIMLAAKIRNIQIQERTPLQIKQTLTGYGKADKKQMQEMVRVHLRLKTAPKPDDCADALAAALCWRA